jgi:phage antirepressor YoqD-like protein|nr:MAG TPA: antirepressor protein [Caudoviricetes sp.]
MRHFNENYSNSNNVAVLSTSAHETSKTFSYNGNDVLFDIKDDVMVNATQLAKIYGKRPNDYLSLPATNQLINAITRKYGIAENQLIRTERGGISPGTWMHRLIVVDFCQWLDIDLKLWCTEKLDELMRYGMTATQPTLEQMINNPDLVISLATQLKSEREEKARIEAESKRKDEVIAKQEPLASFAKTAFATDDKVDIGMSAKILKLGFGRNTLFDKLRKAGVFFANRNEPKQRFIDAGYFEMKEKFIERNNHPGFVVTKVLVTQKGLAYLNHLFGGKPSDGKLAKIV